MEFKLNKIDTDIRKKMQEEIKDNKVHSNKAISVKKDLKEDKNSSKEKYVHEDQREEKKYLTIDGMKNYNEKVSIEVEKIENIDQENSKGRVLDTKK